ncbi:hypothetical protein [Sulfitobacter guttiformis]|uniref:Uncharacterized protein n=1 Tax=Sulfitobacter guttiformis TaxID=74349 RepID=A0A420DS55_9RHOB|nr:hypothetical protein [Sulfitobacter guttiformis]RKE97161.1 hypothetical protein C8N30_1754 [Sulfitobacter guttiformis]
MDLIADILLTFGAIGAGVYCFVLGRRLNRFNDLEKGAGGAVAVLSAQVDDLTRTLTVAKQTAANSAQTLTELSMRAEDISRRLELQMASLHDIPVTSVAQTDQQHKAVPTPSAPPPPPAQANPTTPMFARRTHSTNSAGVE